MRWLGSIADSTGMNVSKLWAMVMDRESSPWGRKESERLNNHSSHHTVREAPAVLLLGGYCSPCFTDGAQRRERTCPGV